MGFFGLLFLDLSYRLEQRQFMTGTQQRQFFPILLFEGREQRSAQRL